MKIGLPKETKDGERRVGLTPANVKQLIDVGHEVFVDETAGEGSGFGGKDYRAVGARLVKDGTAYSGTDLIVKVKEPSAAECKLMHPGQIVFAFLHLAAAPQTLTGLLESKVTAIAYENVQRANQFPLVAPMSVIAGKLAAISGANLVAQHGGLLLSDATALVLGLGVAGKAAFEGVAALGATTKGFDVDPAKLAANKQLFNITDLHQHLETADLIIGAVLRPGKRTPVVLTRDDIKSLKRGCVFIDISIDQGGCAETSRPTTLSNPTFDFDGVIHYCVPNMPGRVPRTSTLALTAVTMPYIMLLANFDSVGGRWDDLKPAVAVRAGQIVDERLKSL